MTSRLARNTCGGSQGIVGEGLLVVVECSARHSFVAFYERAHPSPDYVAPEMAGSAGSAV